MRESCTKEGQKKNLEERERFSEAACRKEAEGKDPGGEEERGRGRQSGEAKEERRSVKEK